MRNPFGLRPPFRALPDGHRQAVFGYGDVDADVHLIGDHPGVHGGGETGVPFTGTAAGEELWGLLRSLGAVTGPRDEPVLENWYCSYRHVCRLQGNRTPTPEEYALLEPTFDAELRAINAHVLCPVGDVATKHVLRAYTTQWRRLAGDDADHDDRDGSPSTAAVSADPGEGTSTAGESIASRLHGEEIRGRGFLVVPLTEPSTWTETVRKRTRQRLEAVLESDYRQTKGVATRVG